MYFMIFGGIIVFLLTNPNYLWLNLFISVCFLFIFSLRHLVMSQSDTLKKYIAWTYCLDLLIIVLPGTIKGQLLYSLMLCSFADCCMYFGILLPILYFIIYMFTRIITLSMTYHEAVRQWVMQLLLQGGGLLLIGTVFYLIGQLFRVNRSLEQTVMTLSEREIRLNTAYEQLSDAYKELELLSVLKERNRIARQIHDTVGHTLTTVLVALEAGRMTVASDPIMAAERYETAHEQAKKALNDMRDSVKMLSESNAVTALKETIEHVIEETAKHTGIVIKHDINLPPILNQRLNELFERVIKECLTNSIRHGNSSAIFIQIHNIDGDILYSCQDNGNGCETMIPGYGLTAMANEICELGGMIHWQSEADEGFEVCIQLPEVNLQ
jgi:signal transduction histidine kinase